MHEYSIVQALIEQCEDYAAQNQASEVSKVVIKIGKLSGVEPHLLEVAFDSFKLTSQVCKQAELVMNLQPVQIFCFACGHTNSLTEHNYICPDCNSDQVSITDGEDMFLMQLEMA